MTPRGELTAGERDRLHAAVKTGIAVPWSEEVVVSSYSSCGLDLDSPRAQVVEMPPFAAGDRVRLASSRFRGWARGRGMVVGLQRFRGGWFVTVRWSRSGLMTHAEADLELVEVV